MEQGNSGCTVRDLLLVIVMPQKTVQTAVGQTGSSSDTTASYEVRLRELLADTYGADMVDVLIFMQGSHRRIMDLAAQRRSRAC